MFLMQVLVLQVLIIVYFIQAFDLLLAYVLINKFYILNLFMC